MRSFCFGGGFLALLLASVCVAQDKKADPREKLETAIPEGIRLLEAKDYKQFLQKFVAPDDLKMIVKKAGSLDKFAEGFAARHATILLEILKAIKDVKPTLEQEGKKATFKLKEKVKGAPRDTVTFLKIDKFWYIQN